MEGAEEGEDLVAGARVEVAGRLVREDDGRIVDRMPDPTAERVLERMKGIEPSGGGVAR